MLEKRKPNQSQVGESGVVKRDIRFTIFLLNIEEKMCRRSFFTNQIVTNRYVPYAPIKYVPPHDVIVVNGVMERCFSQQ